MDEDEDDEVYSQAPKRLDLESYKPAWRAWIDQHYPTAQEARWSCSSATQKMVAEFPELRRVRGTHRLLGQHWWCEDAQGHVVDPTAAQIPSYEGLPEFMQPAPEESPLYQELTDEEVLKYIPSGRCMNCGDAVYRGESVCSPECHEIMRAYLC